MAVRFQDPSNSYEQFEDTTDAVYKRIAGELYQAFFEAEVTGPYPDVRYFDEYTIRQNAIEDALLQTRDAMRIAVLLEGIERPGIIGFIKDHNPYLTDERHRIEKLAEDILRLHPEILLQVKARNDEEDEKLSGRAMHNRRKSADEIYLDAFIYITGILAGLSCVVEGLSCMRLKDEPRIV